MKQLIISLFCLISFSAIAENIDYHQKAVISFQEGNYEKALSFIEDFEHQTNKTDDALRQKIIKCIDYAEKGYNAYSQKQWRNAVSYYQALLDLNPNDTNARNYLNKCNEKIRDLSNSSNTSSGNYTYTSSSQSRSISSRLSDFLTPERRAKYLYLSTSFSESNLIGITFLTNYKFFNFGFSGGIGMCDRDEENPMYLSLDPGIKFKYFSVDCGMGLGISTIEFEDPEFSFLIRPSITIDLPIKKNSRNSISLQLGVNVYPGFDISNFFLGIGFGLGAWDD